MITKSTATVWYAPTKGRRYLSKAAAIHAEACALILRKYPTENEPDVGHYWHWRRDIPRAEVLLRRLKRHIKRSISNQ